jgi:hypothetical protein
VEGMVVAVVEHMGLGKVVGMVVGMVVGICKNSRFKIN